MLFLPALAGTARSPHALYFSIEKIHGETTEFPQPQVDPLAIIAGAFGLVAAGSLVIFLLSGGTSLPLFSFFAGIIAFVVGVLAVGLFGRKGRKRRGKGLAWLGMLAGIGSFLARLLYLVGTGR